MRFLLCLALALSACQSSPGSDGPSPNELGASSVEDLPDPSMIEDVSVDQTTGLLANGVLPVSPSVAIQTIDLWIARLDTASVDGAGDVHDDLDQLRDLLQSSPLDGQAIGLRMKDLAESTAALPDSTLRMSGLVSALRAAGRRLAPDTTATSADSLSVQ